MILHADWFCRGGLSSAIPSISRRSRLPRRRPCRITRRPSTMPPPPIPFSLVQVSGFQKASGREQRIGARLSIAAVRLLNSIHLSFQACVAGLHANHKPGSVTGSRFPDPGSTADAHDSIWGNSEESIRGLFRDGKRKTRFSLSFVFSRLRRPQTAAHPCAAGNSD